MADEKSTLAFETLADPPGVEIIDRIERQRCEFHTSGSVSPTASDTETILFPVDRAVRITTDRIVFPTAVPVIVRNRSGEMIEEVKHLQETSLPRGEYVLGITSQVKIYIEFDSDVEIVSYLDETHILFGDKSAISIGVRSLHTRPAATVTTTEDPADMMAAVSTFKSALKTTDPERAFPNHRGHPPAVQLGDRLSIPPELDGPDTGIRLELPTEYSHIYVAAPLAFYVGATVEPGPTPRLVTEEGFEYSLTSPLGFEAEVERTLKQVFFLDCVTRTEGLFDIDSHERSAIEPYVDLDFASVYEMPLTEQIATYLDVPFSVVEEHVPEWRLTTHVDPSPKPVEQLPFVVDDLAIVRTHDARSTKQSAPRVSTEHDFSRDGVLTRSAGEASSSDQHEYVEPESSDSLEQAWIGDDIPIGASKLTTEAFRNRLDRETTDGDISIRIIQNDSRMDEERDLVGQAYGDRDDLPFKVKVDRGVTVDELREILRSEAEFLHYIGHTERDGFECVDGKLDVSSLDQTGVQAFLLNACNSYHQGLELIQSGAIGGIVTLSEVINTGAVRIGETVARLLNGGFPLRAALTIARQESILGGQYIVVGDGGMSVTQAASLTPNLLEISHTEDEYELEIETYATDAAGLGSVYTPFLRDTDEYYLSSGSIGSFHVSEEELAQFLELEDVPVRVNGELRWTASLSLQDL